jgi:hypothetical protein
LNIINSIKNNDFEMIRRNSLFLILVLALVSVPVFQAAHALTHVSDINTTELGHVDELAHADVHELIHAEDSADYDQICLDCLALTAFGSFFSATSTLSVNSDMQQGLQDIKREDILRSFNSSHLQRAPPQI